MDALQGKYLASAIGSILEWYDFSIYGALADVIADEFFPDDHGLLESFAVFGSAFLMRPLGGMLIGYIGDTMGRKRALEISILMMLVPSFLMGCLPNHSQIGGWAPFLLILLRLIQGLAVGGELISAFIFVIESAPPKEKILWGGASHIPAEAGCLLGMVVAAIARSSLDKSDLASYGWRICFWLGILFGVAGVYLRRGITDSDEFEDALMHDERVIKSAQGEGGFNPVRLALEGYWKQILMVSGAVFVYCMAFYTYFIWWPFLLSDEYGEEDISGRLWINSIMLAIYMCFILVICWYANMYERGDIMVLRIGAIGIIAWSLPGYLLVQTRSQGWVILAQFIFAVLTAFLSAGMPFFMYNAFPVHVRTASIGIAYNIGQAFFGGTAPLICSSLAKLDTLLPCVWGIVVATFSVYCIYRYEEKEVKTPLPSQLKVPLMKENDTI